MRAGGGRWVPPAGMLVCALALALALVAGPAWAHRVNIFAYVEDGQVKGQGYFAGGGNCQVCGVRLLDSGGRELAKGVTDDQGDFSLPLPVGVAPMTVELDAGMGHRSEYELTAKDLAPGQVKAPAASAKEIAPSGVTGQAAPSGEQAPPPAGDDASVAAPAGQVSPQALEEAVGRAVDKALDQRLAPAMDQALGKALAPVRRDLAKLGSGSDPGWREAASGLGYILGLVGLALWWRSRRAGR